MALQGLEVHLLAQSIPPPHGAKGRLLGSWDGGYQGSNPTRQGPCPLSLLLQPKTGS